jgi:pimeloyl-ACP methyl ester carboxylesterase
MKYLNVRYLTIGILLLGVSYVVYNNMTTYDTIARSEIKYLPYELKGKKDSDFLLIFLHGFPNTMRMWDEMIKDLEKEYYCLNISYPNFSEKLQLKWGLELIDLVDLIKETIDYVEKNTPGNRKYKKVVISHDWGAIFTYFLSQKYEHYLSDMVTMDVGIGLELRFKDIIPTLVYQNYLAANFLIGGPIGKFLTNLFVKMSNSYGLTKEDRERIDSSWNYPYYYFWKNFLYYKQLRDDFQITTPIAYVYGTQKPFHFHNEKFLTQLKNCDKCEVHSLDADHWIMRHPDNAEFLVNLIRRRVKYIK